MVIFSHFLIFSFFVFSCFCSASDPNVDLPAPLCALFSCCLVRLSIGGSGPPDETVLSSPACTRRISRRGAAFARLLDPLLVSGDLRGRSNALIFALFIGTPITDSEPVNFSGDPENCGYRRSTSKTTPQGFIFSYIRPGARAAVAPLRVWFLARAVHDSCDTEDLHTPSFVGVTRQQWDPSVLKFLRCRFLCPWPPSSLDPRLASGASAAAKAHSRDKFNGDGRPLNSREKNISRGHFRRCPRLRRMMSKESEAAPFTFRHSKNSTYTRFLFHA